MANKILLLGLVVLSVLLCAGAASAYYYGNGAACGVGPCVVQQQYPVVTGRYVDYNMMPVRVGGYFGQSAPFITNLRPGYYAPTPCIKRPSVITSPYYGGYYGGSTGIYTYGYGSKGASMPYVYGGVM